jgi:hypothetical protein
MSKAKVLSANDLIEGDVVYLDPHHQWTRRLTEALLFTDQNMADAALKQAANQKNTVLGVYLVDVIAEDDAPPRPDHFREAFRAKGPSNRFHGKQAI